MHSRHKSVHDTKQKPAVSVEFLQARFRTSSSAHCRRPAVDTTLLTVCHFVFAAAPRKKLEAEPGARRLRRIITYTKDDGEKVVKEVVYYQGKDEDKVCSDFCLACRPCISAVVITPSADVA